MKRVKMIISLGCAIVAIMIAYLLITKDRSPVEYVNVIDFGADGKDLEDDAKAIQAAIDYSHKTGIGVVKILGNHNYVIKSGLILKEGVELEFGQNTRLFIEGDFRAIEVEKNASIKNGIIEVTNPTFNSEVIYLDGKHKFWSSERTFFDNVTILNSSGNNKGTGIYLYANGSEHFISFVNFQNLKISGFHKGIYLKVEEPKEANEYSWINGNRFKDITLDDCIRCIEIDSAVSIPSESSGNKFSGLQIQLTKKTEKAIVVSGSDNYFEGMIWDTQELNNNALIIELSKESLRSFLLLNLPIEYVQDQGQFNSYSSYMKE